MNNDFMKYKEYENSTQPSSGGNGGLLLLGLFLGIPAIALLVVLFASGNWFFAIALIFFILIALG